ncbi:hypothetical protein [Fibrivirga algicola]|uniref:Uncharacterized protein n=1 Tax=Fibrivirga algicola TaxID=2950420 RepID=A0ABX0QEP6_9BACT|nr:hypothetical protein [Fibrivirga algicola]NID09577.1 hypothetical protein [Fibrivirga algicola]
MKLEQHFRPPIYKFVVYESVEIIQQRLQLAFDRTFGQIMFDVRFNIDGHFTNPEKTTFEIRPAGGVNTQGMSYRFTGNIVLLDELTTAVTLTSTYRFNISFWLFPLLMAVLLCYSIIVTSKPIQTETILLLAGLLIVLYISFKWKPTHSVSLVEDLQKVLKGEPEG